MHHKSIIIASFCLIFSASANAQFKKGTRMVGSSIMTGIYNSGSTEVTYPSPTTGFTLNETSYNLSLTPNLGWFITENIAVGVSVTVNPNGRNTSFEIADTTTQRDKENVFNVGLGSFLRHYFGSSGFMPYGQVGFNAGISSIKRDGFFYGSNIIGPYKSSTDAKSSGGFFANALAAIGLTKMVSPNTGLDLQLGYIFSHTNHRIKSTTNIDYGNNGSIDVSSVGDETRKFNNHGFQVGIAFQIFLDPKK